jgi:hypothetical protein
VRKFLADVIALHFVAMTKVVGNHRVDVGQAHGVVAPGDGFGCGAVLVPGKDYVQENS